MLIFNFTLTEIFLVWYGIGFVFSLVLMYIDWKEGQDIFVPSIFVMSLFGLILIAPILIDYHYNIYKFFTIPGKK